MVKVVSFDVDSTLIDASYANYVWTVAIPQLYAKKRGISFEEASDYVLREYGLIGSNDIRWYLPDYWFNLFNLDENPLEVFRFHLDKVKFYPEVPTILETLSQKYELIIASGGLRKVLELVIEQFKHYFTHTFSSLDHRTRKSLQFYKKICKALGREPEALVHIGDDWYYDFIVPRRIGITSFYLDRTGGKSGKFVVKDLQELEAWLIKL